MSRISERPTLIIDGRRLTRHATGVGRYLILLLNEWAKHPEKLPFAPFVIQHEDRPTELDPWKSVFSHETVGTACPGWIWENLHLATRSRRHSTLFAPANLVPHRWRGPVVLVVHDTFCEHADARIPFVNRLRFRGRYRKSAHRADLILTPSVATAKDVNRFFGVPDNRIRTVRPGIKRFDEFAQQESASVSCDLALPERFVLFVGKIADRRAFPVVIEAVERITAEGAPLKLIRVGPGEAPPHANSEVLIDFGHVPDRLLARLYSEALALVWPSDREGFGLPILEAMTHGCPVITTPVNALEELAGGACLGLSDTSADSITEAIRKLIDDCRLREGLKASGLVRSFDYDPGRFAAEVAEAIASVIG